MSASRSINCQTRAWRQHKDEIRAFLARRAGSTAEADDLLQDVFLKALLQGKDFCRIESPRAWLFQVARNLLLDRLRLTKEQVPLPEGLCADPTPAFEPVDHLSQCLPRVLSELSAEDRDAIVRCDLQGMTQLAYARHLGLTLPAAKSRVQRARQRLQQQLVTDCQVTFDHAGRVCCFVPRAPLESSEK